MELIKQTLNVSKLKEGDTFESEEYTLNRDEIIQFSSEFDPQYFHVNSALAKESFFGELVASGWHTAAVTMRLWMESMEIEHGLVGSTVNMTWPKPVKPMDTLKVLAKIKSISKSKSDDNRLKIVFNNQTINQDGDVVFEYEANVLGFINQ